MNFEHHYNTLISRAKTRIVDSHYERHHIVPRCAGGTDVASNLVDLTPEEHYTAHLLLVKIYKSNKAVYNKLLHACRLMTGSSNIGRKNKLYGWVKRRLREERLGVPLSQAVKDKISASLIKRYDEMPHHLRNCTLSIAHKEKCSKSLIGRALSDKHKENISLSLKDKSKSDEHRAKFRGKNNPAYKDIPTSTALDMVNDYTQGVRILVMCEKYKLSEDKILSVLREHNVNVHQRVCPHCKVIGQTSNMIRWHFDNCKLR